MEGIGIETFKAIIRINHLRKNDTQRIINKVTSLNSIGKIIVKPSEKAFIIAFDSRVIDKKEIIDAIEQLKYTVIY